MQKVFEDDPLQLLDIDLASTQFEKATPNQRAHTLPACCKKLGMRRKKMGQMWLVAEPNQPQDPITTSRRKLH